jgi:hypothetical protein
MSINISKTSTIGEVIDNIPESDKIIEKYFHGGCYHCPAIKMETLEMAAALHGHKIENIIADLHKLIDKK